MSFGCSPSDVLKLLEISTRVYLAFKAFPVQDFEDTLKKCEKTLEPYAEHLVDKKMTVKKFIFTIRYIGMEKEIDGLRKQISGHYQALNMCISFLQLRLHLEATKQTQRLLDAAPSRTVNLGGRSYSTNTLGAPSNRAPLALASSDEHPLFSEWKIFDRWLQSEDERVAQEAGLSRPLSLGDTPATCSTGDVQTAAVLYHLRRQVDDAIFIEENRAKRATAEKRSHLVPSDAMKQQVRNMPPAPLRTYTLETDHSGNFTMFGQESLISVDFPRSSFGKLNKQYVDIKYTFIGHKSANRFQTLLYTNNGADSANLEFDRPILSISSDHNPTECRGRNLRLWRRTETHLADGGLVTSEVLILLFYTSALEEDGHWVEEPHYAFEWLTESVYKKDSDKLTLLFSKDAPRWATDKLFKRRKSSTQTDSEAANPSRKKRNDSMEMLRFSRSDSVTSGSLSGSPIPLKDISGGGGGFSRAANLNRFGYSALEIKFQSRKDRMAFLDIWKQYVKPLSVS
ncbi:hypothetical protein J4E80_009152 [Alternaria sp. BMP 0032]|nr:hypothetical protein J4E80_009152 [Alternaria sp. BMP 0032]